MWKAEVEERRSRQPRQIKKNFQLWHKLNLLTCYVTLIKGHIFSHSSLNVMARISPLSSMKSIEKSLPSLRSFFHILISDLWVILTFMAQLYKNKNMNWKPHKQGNVNLLYMIKILSKHWLLSLSGKESYTK